MIKRCELRKIILNELLREQFEDEGQEISPGLDFGSVDQQIDAFILKFEKDSIQNNEDLASEDLAEALLTLSLTSLLQEQAEDEEEDVAEEEAIEDAEETEKETASTETETETATDDDLKDVAPISDIPQPPLNIDEFTRRVARLAMNYQNLIDVKGSIVERALRFLKENYDLNHANEMIDLLNTQFDFDIGAPDNEPPEAYSIGAFAGGTGTAGGGGAVG